MQGARREDSRIHERHARSSARRLERWMVTPSAISVGERHADLTTSAAAETAASCAAKPRDPDNRRSECDDRGR
jgi:hypothetical protein